MSNTLHNLGCICNLVFFKPNDHVSQDLTKLQRMIKSSTPVAGPCNSYVVQLTVLDFVLGVTGDQPLQSLGMRMCCFSGPSLQEKHRPN